MVYGFKRALVAVALAAYGVVCVASTRLAAAEPAAPSPFSLSAWRARDSQGVKYVGSGVCVECHASITGEQFETPMARALEMPGDSGVLESKPHMTFKQGPYGYKIAREGDRFMFTVTNGAKTISEPILYCFGEGVVGQTFMFRRDGKYIEARVSYFERLKGLALTIGQAPGVPTSIEDALGRPVAADEVVSCFGCHAPTAVEKSQLQLDRLSPGIDCESCHGPGERHVAGARAKDTSDPYIFNPGKLNANDLTQEFCGTCHLSFEQAMLLPGQGEHNNVRFQAYRMFNSPGHRGADPRVSCVACHDPHKKLEHRAAAYDANCLSCHLSNAKEAKTEARNADACPVATKECTTCHMPKVELPGMHAKFADHWIRVVRPGDPVPH